jgi:hypothetical protein
MSENRTRLSVIVGGLPLSGTNGQVLAMDDSAPGGAAFKSPGDIPGLGTIVSRITDNAGSPTKMEVDTTAVNGFFPISMFFTGEKRARFRQAINTSPLHPLVILESVNSTNLDIRAPEGFGVYLQGTAVSDIVGKLNTISEGAQVNPGAVNQAAEANPVNTNGTQPLNTQTLATALSTNAFDRLSTNGRGFSPRAIVEIIEKFGIAPIRTLITALTTRVTALEGAAISRTVHNLPSWANNAVTALAHGLPSMPVNVAVVLVNLTAEAGYSPGEMVYINSGLESDQTWSSSYTYGVVVSTDAALLYASVSLNGIRIRNKNLTTASIITPVRWQMRIIAYR